MIHIQSYGESLPVLGPRPTAPAHLQLAGGVLAGTQELLRSLSEGNHESLVLWAGRPSARGAVITHVIAPEVEAGYDRLDLPSASRAEVALLLRRERLLVCSDLHTHPETAFLSIADQQRPFSTLPGFYAIVVPDFARGAPGDGWRMYMYDGTRWEEQDFAQRISPWPV